MRLQSDVGRAVWPLCRQPNDATPTAIQQITPRLGATPPRVRTVLLEASDPETPDAPGMVVLDEYVADPSRPDKN
ncbi:MAG TPA: hypothetical protein VJ301_12800 [Propionibacteriaceae bacterium]|nr:hypothetical protein [Propionibacteriaceae bacterium]